VTYRAGPLSSLALAGAWGVGSPARSPRLVLRWSRSPGTSRHLPSWPPLGEHPDRGGGCGRRDGSAEPAGPVRAGGSHPRRRRQPCDASASVPDVGDVLRQLACRRQDRVHLAAWPGGVPGGARAAFETLGGIPYGQIRYDNLRSAVHRCCSVAAGSSHCDGRRSGHVTDSPRSTACLDSRGRMRRAGWKATAAGSDVAIWCRCRGWTRWPS
jgi:hypothetical protein